MTNFTYETETIKGIEYHVYSCDSKKGTQSQELFNSVPEGMQYVNKWHTGQEEERDLTWTKEVESISELSGLDIIDRYSNFDMDVLFTQQLTTAQETALDNAFDNHVAPVAI